MGGGILNGCNDKGTIWPQMCATVCPGLHKHRVFRGGRELPGTPWAGGPSLPTCCCRQSLAQAMQLWGDVLWEQHLQRDTAAPGVGVHELRQSLWLIPGNDLTPLCCSHGCFLHRAGFWQPMGPSTTASAPGNGLSISRALFPVTLIMCSVVLG